MAREEGSPTAGSCRVRAPAKRATGNSSSAVSVTFTDVVTATLNGVNPTIDLAADLDITGNAFNIGNCSPEISVIQRL